MTRPGIEPMSPGSLANTLPVTMLLILSFFVWPLLHSGYHHVHFLSPFLFVFLGELSDPHYKSLYVLSSTYVLFLCRVFLLWNNLPHTFLLILGDILLNIGSCLVSAAILSKDKTSVPIQCNNVL